jgi:hypothetical protein
MSKFPEFVSRTACANLDVTLDIIAAGAFVLTLLLYWQDIRRGIKDVGFVGVSLRAERGRRRGI